MYEIQTKCNQTEISYLLMKNGRSIHGYLNYAKAKNCNVDSVFSKAEKWHAEGSSPWRLSKLTLWT